MLSKESLPNESRRLLNSVPALIEKTFPIPGRFRNTLPSDIRKLSGLLTNNRGERALSYLGRPNFLSAYLYWFLPWNLWRLSNLLPALNFNLSEGDVITDLGCGPLTFTSALWITRPDLRKIPLEFYCVDRTASALEAGKKFFEAVTSDDDTWKIHLVRKDINLNQPKAATADHKSSLVCAVNFFNELYERVPHNNLEELRRMAQKSSNFMRTQASEKSSILVIEPGIPQSGKFIALLRDTFMEAGHCPTSPCVHTSKCPCMTSSPKEQKNKWCHFAFETADVPKDLRRLSVSAKLPKERLALSYLMTSTTAKTEAQPLVRVISDAFPLPGSRFGRYGCSAQGLVLLAGEKKRIEKIRAMSIINQNELILSNNIDKKSGAVILELQ
ncbi:MAG: small ribosomal subunit Rsm22 family protein [Treponema sp.]|nr:small ribosomal subunit Rsm22 family protein [Treponema sp.]